MRPSGEIEGRRLRIQLPKSTALNLGLPKCPSTKEHDRSFLCQKDSSGSALNEQSFGSGPQAWEVLLLVPEASQPSPPNLPGRGAAGMLTKSLH